MSDGIKIDGLPEVLVWDRVSGPVRSEIYAQVADNLYRLL